VRAGLARDDGAPFNIVLAYRLQARASSLQQGIALPNRHPVLITKDAHRPRWRVFYDRVDLALRRTTIS